MGAEHREGRDQRRHRPELRGADARTRRGRWPSTCTTRPSCRTAWRTTPSPKLAQDVDSTIYELHVRDYSMGDAKVPARPAWQLPRVRRRTATAARTSRRSPRPGLNTVHLLPTFDIASIEEDPAKQQTPQCDLASYAPGQRPAAEVRHRRRRQGRLQLGLRPATTGACRTGRTRRRPRRPTAAPRVAEFRTMVGALHQDGLRVVLDQVFNHTPGLRPGATSRCSTRWCRATTSASTRPARSRPRRAARTSRPSTRWREKLMVDSVVSWARNYHVDGFRFDLMGHHSRANMLAVRSALDALTLQKDGVDGKSDLPLRRGLELRRGGRQQALRPGDAGSARRHGHRHLLRPSA